MDSLSIKKSLSASLSDGKLAAHIAMGLGDKKKTTEINKLIKNYFLEIKTVKPKGKMQKVFLFRESFKYDSIYYEYKGKFSKKDAEQMEKDAASDEDVFYFDDVEKEKIFLFKHDPDGRMFKGKEIFSSLKDLPKTWLDANKCDYDLLDDAPEGITHCNSKTKLVGIVIDTNI
jgi:hypothetical protein